MNAKPKSLTAGRSAASNIEPAAFSMEETAAYLRISRAGVYNLVRRGDLKAARIGHRIVIRRVDADAFLDSCVVSA